MNWFVWRQHKRALLLFATMLIVYAAFVVPSGLHFWHVYQQTLVDCRQNPANPTCGDLASNLFQSNMDQILLQLVPLAVLFLPVILGMFWGAPLLAREYAEGTNNLIWTQSVSRRRWLTVKLAWTLFASALFTGAFAALLTWWSKTPNSLNMNRFSYTPFDTQGIVPVACGLFVVAFGIMCGAWFRKTMVAVGVVLGLFIAFVLITVQNLARPHYMAPITVTAPMGPNAMENIPTGAWVLTQSIVDKNGKIIGDIFPAAPPQCQQIIQQYQTSSNNSNGHTVHIKSVPGVGDPIDACLNKAGFHQVAKYQPSYRYWDFQRIEASIYLGLTIIAVAGTYILVLRRDA